MPVKNIDDILTTTSPAVSQYDRQSIVLFVATSIGKYLNFIGMPNSMTEEATFETAQMMLDNHPHIQAEAIKSFFYECKRGTYGYHYNKMDGSKILMWYDKFVNDYYVQLEEQAYEQHQQAKEGLSAPVTLQEGDRELTSQELADMYSQLLNGKTVAQKEKDDRIAAIRLEVINKNMGVYSLLSPEEAEAFINQEINKRLQQENLI